MQIFKIIGRKFKINIANFGKILYNIKKEK